MLKKLKNIEVDWSLVAFLYIVIKASIVHTIHWAEVCGIALVLVVHYAKHLIPKRKTLVQYEEDFFGMLKDLETQVKMTNQDLSNIKLMLGVRKEKSLK